MKKVMMSYQSRKSQNGEKRHLSRWFQLLGLVFIVILSIISGCSSVTYDLSTLNGPKIFLFNEQEKQIEGLDLELKEIIDLTKANEIVDYILLLLVNGVSSSNLKPTIEDASIIQQYSIDYKNVTINFANSYFDLPDDEEIYLRATIVKSLTSFDLIDSVEFFVGGVPLKLNSTTSLGRQYYDDVLVTYDEASSREDKEIVIMYYPNDEKKRLVATYTSVLVTPDKKLEEIVVNQLLSNEKQVFPKDVKLLNVYTHEGICFVDFSSEFLTSLLPSGVSERIAIYSLVNSLTELSNITNVQILVEGEKASTFQGTLSLNRIFTKNFSLIDTDNGR